MGKARVPNAGTRQAGSSMSPTLWAPRRATGRRVESPGRQVDAEFPIGAAVELGRTTGARALATEIRR